MSKSEALLSNLLPKGTEHCFSQPLWSSESTSSWRWRVSAHRCCQGLGHERVCIWVCACVMSSGWWVGPLITSHAWDRTPWGPNTTTLHPQCVLSIHTNNEVARLRRKQLIHTSTLLHVRKLLACTWKMKRLETGTLCFMYVSYTFIQDSAYLPLEL